MPLKPFIQGRCLTASPLLCLRYGDLLCVPMVSLASCIRLRINANSGWHGTTAGVCAKSATLVALITHNWREVQQLEYQQYIGCACSPLAARTSWMSLITNCLHFTFAQHRKDLSESDEIHWCHS